MTVPTPDLLRLLDEAKKYTHGDCFADTDAGFCAYTAFDNLIAWLTQHRDGLGWKLIETAPKDGTHILAFEKGFIIQARWAEYYRYAYAGQPAVYGWQPSPCGEADQSDQVFPTHWRALPLPPHTEDGG